MKRVLFLLGVVVTAGALSAPAHAADQLIPGKLFIAKAGGKLVKVLSKGTFTLPVADPSATGGTLHVFDEGATGGDDTYTLSPGNFSGLGSPPGAKGWKYKGAGTAVDPCKVLLIKENLIKAVCKDKGAGGVLQTPPYTGLGGVVLDIGAGSDRYCAEFGGTEVKNDDKLVKRKDASAPASCPSVAPPGCPLAAGQYTTTQVSGGSLKVYTFAAFPFPAGGTIVQDVAAASLPDCIHDTVVPFPGGFTAPNFCVPALGYTVSVTQTGCGVGQIDSNGGSDYKIEENNDTSDSSVTCNLPQMGCPPGPPTIGSDASTRVDVTTGGGTATCAGSGLANVLVTVPVHTKTWQDNSVGTFGACTGDGTFNGGDMVITEFDQILDFTTDEAHAHWSDIDGDGCSIAGGGPINGQALIKGECLDTGAMTAKTVAAGGFGSTGVPQDGSFSTSLPNTVALTGAFAGATCGSPPALSFTAGTVTRCLP